MYLKPYVCFLCVCREAVDLKETKEYVDPQESRDWWGPREAVEKMDVMDMWWVSWKRLPEVLGIGRIM